MMTNNGQDAIWDGGLSQTPWSTTDGTGILDRQHTLLYGLFFPGDESTCLRPAGISTNQV